MLIQMPYMLFSRHQALMTALVILMTPEASTHLAAQWLKYPTAGVPRKADGKVDMSAHCPPDARWQTRLFRDLDYCRAF